ncbi:hypothetical protein NBRC116589_15940 [Ruegeria sp. HU-ET01832]|uniref:hypothetical protein n=1 Tax=Ruegeria sp. HU-ET01832 TaxID=3135906 RepID=UPI00310650E3
MREEYDKPLHSPLPWKSMESEGQVLDETKLDLAIADLMNQEHSVKSEPEPTPPTIPASEDKPQEAAPDTVIGFSASLRQKWAELVGAA